MPLNIEGVKHFLANGRVYRMSTTVSDIGTQAEAFAQFFARSQVNIPELKLPELSAWMDKYPTQEITTVDCRMTNRSTRPMRIFDSGNKVRCARTETSLIVAIPLRDYIPFRSRFYNPTGTRRLLHLYPQSTPAQETIAESLVMRATLPYVLPFPTWIILELTAAKDFVPHNNSLIQAYLVAVTKDDTWTYAMPNIFVDGRMCLGQVAWSQGKPLQQAIIDLLEAYFQGEYNTHLLDPNRAAYHLRWDFGGAHALPNLNDQGMFLHKTWNNCFEVIR